MTIGRFIPSIVGGRLILNLEYFTGGSIKNFTDWWGPYTRDDWLIKYEAGISEYIDTLWNVESMGLIISYRGYNIYPIAAHTISSGSGSADGTLSVTMPAIKDTGIPASEWEYNTIAGISGGRISFFKDRFFGGGNNIGFNIGVRNGPARSHLMLGISVQKSGASYADWPVFSTVKDPSGENWSEPNEMVVDGTVWLTADSRAWPNGVYNTDAYVYECEGSPGSWSTVKQLDTNHIEGAFIVVRDIVPEPEGGGGGDGGGGGGGESNPYKERMIYGYVRWSSTGKPAGGTPVSINEYPLIGTVSRFDGYYELTGLPEVSQVVHVTAAPPYGTTQTKTCSIPGPNEQWRLDFSV